ncbi:MAG: hypothetical protein DRP60_16920 [Spirochaetes bacterium]|nr:MAG: hypothetical protein DRP60_16920 [Spirochaetota bacterium]
MTSANLRIIPAGFLLLFLFLLSSCSSKPKEPGEVYTRRLQADALLVQGYNQTDVLKFNPAWASFNQALNIYASLDNREGMINALLALGRTRRLTGDIDSTEELYNHARSLAVYSEDPRAMRSVLNHQADLALRQGNPEGAMALLTDRENELTEGRERSAQLRLRGSARAALGFGDEAALLLVEAAEIALASGEAAAAAQAYYKLASLSSLGARFEEAESWALKALEADKSLEYASGIAADLRALAIISAKAEKNEAAEDYYRRSWLAWRALGRSKEAETARTELENISGRLVTVP